MKLPAAERKRRLLTRRRNEALAALEAWVRARVPPERLQAVASAQEGTLGREVFALISELDRATATVEPLARAALRYVEALPRPRRR